MTELRPTSKGWQTRAANRCTAWETDLRTAADALAEAHVAYVRGDVDAAANIVQGAKFLLNAPMHSMNLILHKDRITLSVFQRYNAFMDGSDLHIIVSKPEVENPLG